MNVEIAERLAARRKEAGLSQEALAEQLGVSRQAVSKWERSESSPDTDNLIALAELYGVSLDELLYVDERIKEDVKFEAADRATQYKQEKTEPADTASHDASTSQERQSGDPAKKDEYVRIGLKGIHVEDGEDSVHISWKDGIHVNSGEKGDEVHVGWDGVHVKEGVGFHGEKCAAQCASTPGETNSGWGTYQSEEVSWDKDRIEINGEHFDNWRQVRDKYGHGHFHYYVEHKNPLLKFPFPLVAIIAYLLLGFTMDAWAAGLFVFFTIPLYYMIASSIVEKRIVPFLSGAYPLGCVAWFLWMAFVVGQPHPAWIIFLTIPIFEWIVVSLSRGRRRRHKNRQPIEVEAEVTDKQ